MVVAVRRSKFGNVRGQIDGLTFDSQAEGRRYLALRDRQARGEISALTVHPTYRFEHAGVKIGRYTPDFSYVENGQTVVEDVKSKPTKTEAYGLRKRLMLAFYGLTVVEVTG